MDAWTDQEFWKFFRMDRSKFRELCDKLRGEIESPFTYSAETMVACTIGYIRSNAHQELVARLLGVAQSSVSRYVTKVCAAIARRADDFIVFPLDQEQLNENEVLFGEAGLDAIGAIDCTHIQIQVPNRDAERIYLNRRLYHSLNVQLVVDAHGRIINLCARFPGSVHDAHILRSSVLCAAFETIPELRRRRLLADLGYPGFQWLRLPIRNAESAADREYNRRHSAARSYVERVIAWLKRRYSALHGEIRLDIEHIPQFIISAACLWIFSKDCAPPFDREQQDGDEEWMDVDEWPQRDFDPEEYGMF